MMPLRASALHSSSSGTVKYKNTLCALPEWLQEVLSSTKMGKLPFRLCQGSQGIEEAEQGFCAI